MAAAADGEATRALSAIDIDVGARILARMVSQVEVAIVDPSGISLRFLTTPISIRSRNLAGRARSSIKVKKKMSLKILLKKLVNS